MNEFIVYTLGELRAAFRAAAKPTFEEARENPVVIQYKTCRMTFTEGIHESRANELVRNTRDRHLRGLAHD